MSSSHLATETPLRGDAEPGDNRQNLASLRTLLETVGERQESHERILRFIAECVAPKGEDSSQINDLIGLLIAKIDGQSAMIRSIAGQIQRQGRTLSGAVVQALDEARGGGDGAAGKGNGANGRGQAAP